MFFEGDFIAAKWVKYSLYISTNFEGRGCLSETLEFKNPTNSAELPASPSITAFPTSPIIIPGSASMANILNVFATGGAAIAKVSRSQIRLEFS